MVTVAAGAAAMGTTPEPDRRSVLVVVDDDGLLADLRARLDARPSWDVRWAPGATAAAQRIASEPVDLLVTGVGAPLAGAEELHAAVGRHRAGQAHLLLHEPTGQTGGLFAGPFVRDGSLTAATTEDLGVCLSGVLEAAGDLRLVESLRAVGGAQRLPAAPQAYADLMGTAERTDGDLDEIASRIEADPDLCERILQVVNSAWLALPRSVEHVRDAVCVLGLERVSKLVLSSELFRTWSQTTAQVQRLAVEGRAHAHEVASATLHIAKQAGLGTDGCLAAGLLHDCGRLVLAMTAPAELERVAALAREDGVAEWAAEEALFGCSHAEVGAALLGAWGLSGAVVRAVAFHHQPLRAACSEFDLSAALHVAGALVDGRRPHPDLVRQLGIVEQVPAWEQDLRPDDEAAA